MKRTTYIKKLQQKTDDFVLVGDYNGTNKEVTIRHLACNREFKRTAGYFLQEPKCPHCHRDHVQGLDINVDLPKDIEQLELYHGANVPIWFRHSCGHEFRISPKLFLDGKNHCPICSKGNSLEMAQQKLGAEWIIIPETYTSMTRLCTIKHKCGFMIQRSVGKIVYNKIMPRCPKCSKNSILNKQREFNRRLWDIYSKYSHNELVHVTIHNHTVALQCNFCGEKFSLSKTHNCEGRKKFLQRRNFESKVINHPDYEMLEDFKGFNIEHNFIHKTCGHIFSATPSKVFGRDNRGKTACPNCMGVKGMRKTNRQVQKELDTRYGKNEFILLSEYHSCEEPITVRHSCGHEYQVRAESLLHPSSGRDKYSKCPACVKSVNSRGARKIEDWLMQQGLEYKREYIFSDCKDSYNLPFDFAVFYNGRTYLVEFDGKQHYEYVPYFGKESFMSTRKHDKMKNDYCRLRDIPLLRITWLSYDHVEFMLDEFLYGLTLE